MGSSIPNNWKRPWTEDNKLPSITLPHPTDSASSRTHQNSEPSLSNASQRISSQSATQDLRNVDPEDRVLHAMPNASSSDPYTQYLLAQNSPENSTKRMRMTESPWLDLKGKGLSAQSQTLSRSESKSNDESRSRASMWTPVPAVAAPAKPRDMSGMYARARSRHDGNHCSSCAKVQSIIPDIAKGLQQINEQLKSVATRRQTTEENIPEAERIDRTIPDDLLDTLGFSIREINDSKRLVGDLVSAIQVDNNRGVFKSRGSIGDERRLSHTSRSVSPNSDDRANSREPYSSSILSRSPQSRHLPSPHPFHLSTIGGTGVASKTSDSSTLAGQLQELQQQLNAKSASHRALEAEYAQLYAIHSQAQTKHATLEKKTSSADSEVNALMEERVHLQIQVEDLEQQVADLQSSRDSAHTQSAASASQYLQIMAMSSKLQAQGALDLKKYKSDREAWATQKQELEQKILNLEKAQSTTSIFAATLAASGKTAEEQNVNDEAGLANMSFEKLKDEIMTLRRNVREASAVIQIIREEGGIITKLTGELGCVGERLVRLGFIPEPAHST